MELVLTTRRPTERLPNSCRAFTYLRKQVSIERPGLYSGT